MPVLNIVNRESGDVTIVDLSGKIELGPQGTELFLTEATKLLTEDGRKKVVLNFADVSHMDAAGVGILTTIGQMALTQQAKVKLLNLGQRIRDLLTISKTLIAFETFDDEASAVESLA